MIPSSQETITDDFAPKDGDRVLKRFFQRRATALLLAIVFALVTGQPILAQGATIPPLAVQATSALIMDFGSGQVLLEQNADQALAPASLAKIMTLRLAFKALKEGKVKLDDDVTISVNAWSGNPVFRGSSVMFLKDGTKVKFGDLLKGIGIASGNDASVAVAEHLAGSVDAFVALMNQEGKSLGLTQALFIDPHGLSPDALITAREMAILARAYIKDFPESLQIHSTPTFTTTLPTGEVITQQNRNLLLRKVPGVDGLKTGRLGVVGFNFVVTGVQGNMRLIGVLFGAESEAARAQQGEAMLKWGFGNFASVEPFKAGDQVGTVRVLKGRKNQLALVTPAPVLLAVVKGQEARIERRTDLPKEVTAPVAKGQKLGEVVFSVDGKELRRVDLIAAEEVKRGGFFKVLFDSARMFFSGLFRRG